MKIKIANVRPWNGAVHKCYSCGRSFIHNGNCPYCGQRLGH